MGSLDEYHASLESSRKWFRKNHPGVIASFQVLDDGFNELATMLQLGRDAKEKSHVSLAPLLMILQRQAFVALDALSSMQAYQAWVLLRPGLESALFMGKWTDDVANYHIWERRLADPKRYQSTYSGKALVSTSLPRATDLQAVLRSVNDSFLHPNPGYYTRHVSLAERESGDVELKLHFFDDDSFHWASVLAMLHLLILTQESIAGMFAHRFVNIEIEPEHFGLAGFQSQQGLAARKAAATGATEAYIIRDLGLWNLDAEA